MEVEDVIDRALRAVQRPKVGSIERQWLEGKRNVGLTAKL
jgi:hypothetical protein